ncbi:F510_1955 family glycosylhydrolase [Brevibacillus choshinensis]|uniref:F510_1955 family glycosylhydrolase n=1 Tax=Brevibacillus choshinensis TaxID=54911 RepID=UPI002E230036|nr:glycosyl hydrolase [Brevibacillus choshinensis]
MGLTLVGTALITLIIFVWFIVTRRQIESLKNVKKQEEREKRLKLSRTLGYLKWGLIASFLVVVATGALAILGNTKDQDIYLEHTHGLGYSPDGKRILIPAHAGLRVYEDGRWKTPEGEKHDYMGFSSVNDGFYSSGHPAQGSKLNNPFGIVKSTDEGKTIKSLALDGETDFHNMAVGYTSHVIYAINPEPNSKMSSAGLYFSKDDGSSWTKSDMNGITEEPTAMAVHPTEPSILAIGTPTAVYLSNDYGNVFEKVTSAGQATALFFTNKGELFIGGYQNNAYLRKMDVTSKKSEELKIPELEKDAVAFISQNPTDEKELAFVTFKNDVYLSTDESSNWTKIADEGKAISKDNKNGNEKE